MFEGEIEVENGHKYVQLCPVGPGFFACFAEDKLGNDTVKVTYESIIAIALQANGDAVYLCHDEDGAPHNPREASNFIKIFAPRPEGFTQTLKNEMFLKKS